MAVPGFSYQPCISPIPRASRRTLFTRNGFRISSNANFASKFQAFEGKNEYSEHAEEKAFQKLVEEEVSAEARDASNILSLAKDLVKSLELYTEDEVLEARKIASRLIMAEDKVEKVISELSEAGKLNDVLLQVIKNRAALAQMDKDENALMCLDLLHKRLQTELKRKKASPSLILLNEILHIPRTGSDAQWVSKAEKKMREHFVAENPLGLYRSITNLDQLEEMEDRNLLYRSDFVTEVDEVLYQAMQSMPCEDVAGDNDEAVAIKLRLNQRQQAIERVRQVRDIAIHLRW